MPVLFNPVVIEDYQDCKNATPDWLTAAEQRQQGNPQMTEVLNGLQRYFEEGDRYHFIASSVFDFEWMDRLETHGEGPFLFLAEGVFMYLEEADLRRLVLELQRHLPAVQWVGSVGMALCANAEEVYDHAEDPYEWTNLATMPEYAATVAAMKRRLPECVPR